MELIYSYVQNDTSKDTRFLSLKKAFNYLLILLISNFIRIAHANILNSLILL